MTGIENDIIQGVGAISTSKTLGAYYQDITPSEIHITKGVFASLDDNGIPYCIENNERKYYIVTVIQYALICYEKIIKHTDVNENKERFLTCINWLDGKKENFKDSYVFRSAENQHYQLPDGWVSGMYQGQAISLYLRAHQLTGDNSYLKTASLIFNSFNYDYAEGGFKRIDDKGYLWFEEYPTEHPSYVLNGFIYAIFGLLDYYRVTGNTLAKEMWDDCIKTIESNLHKYDVWYWSIYDQLKKELVSYYYQKNVHIPLMQILYKLTENEIFGKYAKKWEKNLNNNLHYLFTKIMYRIRPRIIKLKSFLRK